MSKAEEARLIKEIATALADLGDRERSDVLLYAEGGRAWMGGSIFTTREDTIVWHSSGETDVSDLVMDLWAAAPPGNKWRGMTMFVSGDDFRTEFDDGESWKADEEEGDRREPIVRAYFGDKPIYYPPLEGAEPWPED